MDRKGFRFLEAALSWDGKRSFDLERMPALLHALGNPQNAVKAVHVTGSNGKGSVCAFVSAMLISAGYRVGQTSSPHLEHPAERCLVNGRPVSEEFLETALARIADVSSLLSLTPSYFETITAAAFLVFAEQCVDWMVVEVGLGGRLDATNTMHSPAVCAVTSISLEHTEILGPTLRHIAREKSGIFRANVPVVCGALPVDAIDEIELSAERLAASVDVLGRDFHIDDSGVYRCGELLIPLPFKECALQGDYQRRNAAVACRIAELVGLSATAMVDGMRRVQWPGRLEFVPGWRTSAGQVIDVLLDAAHNPEGIDVLLQYLEKIVTESRWRKVVIVFSALTRKPWAQMLGRIRDFREELLSRGVPSELVLTQSSHPHAVLSDALLQGAEQDAQVVSLKDVLPAVERAAAGNTLLVVAGSMFLLADLRPKFVSEPFATYRSGR